MATPVIRTLHIVYSLFGRNVNETRTLDLPYRTNAGTTNDNIRDLHQDVIELLQPLVPEQVQFIRATSSVMRAPKTPPIKRGQQVAQKYALEGTKENQANLEIADGDYVALFEKSADNGNNGLMQIRGSFLQGDVVSVTGSPQLKQNFDTAPYIALANALPDVFTDNLCTMILPAQGGDSFVSGARPVTELTFIGVGKRNQTITRRSSKQNKKAYAIDILQDILRRVNDLYYNPDGTINPLETELANAFAVEVMPLVEAFELTYVATLAPYKALPQAIRTQVQILNALDNGV